MIPHDARRAIRVPYRELKIRAAHISKRAGLRYEYGTVRYSTAEIINRYSNNQYGTVRQKSSVGCCPAWRPHQSSVLRADQVLICPERHVRSSLELRVLYRTVALINESVWEITVLYRYRTSHLTYWCYGTCSPVLSSLLLIVLYSYCTAPSLRLRQHLIVAIYPYSYSMLSDYL